MQKVTARCRWARLPTIARREGVTSRSTAATAAPAADVDAPPPPLPPPPPPHVSVPPATDAAAAVDAAAKPSVVAGATSHQGSAMPAGRRASGSQRKGAKAGGEARALHVVGLDWGPRS